LRTKLLKIVLLKKIKILKLIKSLVALKSFKKLELCHNELFIINTKIIKPISLEVLNLSEFHPLLYKIKIH